MKFELNDVEKKWINALIQDVDKNNLLRKMLSTYPETCFNISEIEYDLNECFENKNMENFIKESLFVLYCNHQCYLCKYKHMYYCVNAKDGGGVEACGNQIQNCINTIIMNQWGLYDLFKYGLSKENLEELNDSYGGDFEKDLNDYRILCNSIGLKYSDNQQNYQNEIDEFDELMRKKGIYE